MQHHDDTPIPGRNAANPAIQRAVAGDEDAFRALYRRHAGATWGLAHALTGTTRDAVTVTAESFARTFTVLQADRPERPELTTLLLRTARESAIDVRRAHGDSPPPFEAREDTITLATAFATLPERWPATRFVPMVLLRSGQHVNKTESAVRLTHLPTGIVVACQNERSQIKNRATAMKVLKSRLYDREMQLRAAEQAKTEDEKMRINFGSQIRSYVLHPYRMVKDHRTKTEIGDADRVLDGDLEELIQALLNRSA